jgi:hypothetical protein
LEGIGALAVIGLPLIVGGAAASWCLAKQQRSTLLGILSGTAALFVGALFGWGAPALNPVKAPKELVESSRAREPAKEIRVACYQYFQPSLVFYCGREIARFETEDEAQEFLRSPLEVYLFVPEALWQQLKQKAPKYAHQVAARTDYFRRCDVVVIASRPLHDAMITGVQSRTFTNSTSKISSALGGMAGGRPSSP